MVGFIVDGVLHKNLLISLSVHMLISVEIILVRRMTGVIVWVSFGVVTKCLVVIFFPIRHSGI